MEDNKFINSTLFAPWIRGAVELDETAQVVFIELMAERFGKEITKAVDSSFNESRDAIFNSVIIKDGINVPENFTEEVIKKTSAALLKEVFSGRTFKGGTIETSTVDENTAVNIASTMAENDIASGILKGLMDEAVAEIIKRFEAAVVMPKHIVAEDIMVDGATVKGIMSSDVVSINKTIAMSPEALQGLVTMLQPYFGVANKAVVEGGSNE